MERTLSVFASQIHLPRKGEVLLYLPKDAKKLPLRGSWQARPGLTERGHSQNYPLRLTTFARFPLLSLRDIFPRSGGSRPSRGRLCAMLETLPPPPKAVPLGKVASPQAMTEGVIISSAAFCAFRLLHFACFHSKIKCTAIVFCKNAALADPKLFTADAAPL